MEEEKIELRQIRDFGAIINDTFVFAKQNLKPLLKVFFILCGVFILGSVLATAIQQNKVVHLVNETGSGQYPGRNTRISSYMGWEYAMVIFFALLNYTAITGTVLSYISLYLEKGKQAPSVEEVWSYFRYFFMRILGSVTLLGIALVIAIMLCLVPGIYLFPIISLVYPVMVLENGTLRYSFDRSYSLIKNNWWVTFGTLLIIWLIAYACMSLVSLPAILMQTVSMFSQTKPELTLTFTFISAVINGICHIFMVIPVIGVSLCYFSLAEQKDGTGLMERISTLGNSGTKPDTLSEEY
ncbi:hypothetical protein FW774_00885 (plasmid) [Pedobacter sp. BS3]|uniref:hypothetical protein n=1 Tax=Pedobacter sp. BS3 TaxID=2567937 RepID=UPI0011EC7EEB|nr:hypothetical protein [Pedobacter sp. BS3]TZF85665.1 hypothetical protein FW774_00885 [Pedobacter sp. BS3]